MWPACLLFPPILGTKCMQSPVRCIFGRTFAMSCFHLDCHAATFCHALFLYVDWRLDSCMWVLIGSLV